MGKKQSLRGKATHFVSVLLNPISDSDTNNHKPSTQPPPPSEEVGELKITASETTDEEGNHHDFVDGPDTSSFTAFLYSLLSSSDTGDNTNPNGQSDDKVAPDNNPLPDSSSLKENNGGRKSVFSRSKQSLGRAIRLVGRIGGFRHQDRKDNLEMKFDDANGSKISGVEMRRVEPVKESVPVTLVDLPEISEPSVLLSDSIRNSLYASLPPLLHGRKWQLLYSTWRHGISLSTLYRRSMLWPGLSVLVVGDQKGAVFGSLVEAPLRPSSKRKYQGTNNTYVFTNTSGRPVIYRPTATILQGLTAISHFATLTTWQLVGEVILLFIWMVICKDFVLPLHYPFLSNIISPPSFNIISLSIIFWLTFQIHDICFKRLNGSSSVSETYGNPCLAHSQDFEVKEVELWGFVQTSKYEEVLALSRTEVPGICRW